MEWLNKELLFEALQYPLAAIPDFLRKKQIESGWSKEVFFEFLKTHTLLIRKELFKEKPKRLDELTNGKVKEARTLSLEKKDVLDEEILSLLDFAIKKALDLYNPTPKFSNLQIVSFLEATLEFIITEYETQAALRRNQLHTFFLGDTDKTKDGRTIYFVNNYTIKLPTPAFDLIILKHALRDLLLNSSQIGKLQKLLKPRVDECKKIVELWNKKILPLEARKEDEELQRKNRLISFSPETLQFTTYDSSYYYHFINGKNKRYTNNDLATFAFNAGNLISNEILEENGKISTLKENEKKWGNSTFLLYYYHLRQSEGKELTETNVEEIASKHSLNRITLRRKFNDMLENNFEADEHTNSRTKFREDYELILPELEQQNQKAYKTVYIKHEILVTSLKAPKK